MIAGMAVADLAPPDDYNRVLADLKRAVASANLRAVRTVNIELLRLYWTIGRAILDQQAQGRTRRRARLTAYPFEEVLRERPPRRRDCTDEEGRRRGCPVSR